MEGFDTVWQEIQGKGNRSYPRHWPEDLPETHWCLMGTLVRALTRWANKPRHVLTAMVRRHVFKTGEMCWRGHNVFIDKKGALEVWTKLVPADARPEVKARPDLHDKTLLVTIPQFVRGQPPEGWQGTPYEFFKALTGCERHDLHGCILAFLKRQNDTLHAQDIRWTLQRRPDGRPWLHLWLAVKLPEPPPPPPRPIEDPAPEPMVRLAPARDEDVETVLKTFGPEIPEASKYALEAQRARLQAARDFREYNRRPSTRYRAAVMRDGDAWIAFVPGWPTPTVVGRAATPDEAMRDFDRKFMGVES